MSVTAVAANHGLEVRRTPHGWGLFRHGCALYESNDRQRVEGALAEELDKASLGVFLRSLLVQQEQTTETAAPAPPPRPRQPQWPAPPLAEQRESAEHEAAHAVAAWSLDYPVTDIWIERTTRRGRNDKGRAVHGVTTSPWKIGDDLSRCDAAVICFAGSIANALSVGATWDEFMDATEYDLDTFGGGGDWPEAVGILRRGGPRFSRELCGEPYDTDRALAAPLVWQTWRWLAQPTRQRLIHALADGLLSPDRPPRMTETEIDRVLRGALPSSALSGMSRWWWTRGVCERRTTRPPTPRFRGSWGFSPTWCPFAPTPRRRVACPTGLL
jgi:hypothetical protein